MSTPWSIEFKENILIVVKNDVLVRVADDNSNGAFLGLWDRLRLDAGFDVTVNDALDELAHGLLAKFLGLIEWVLVVVQGILDGESREFLWLEVKVGGVGAESLSINGSKVDKALELLSERSSSVGKFLTLLSGFGEDIGKGNTGLKRG